MLGLDLSTVVFQVLNFLILLAVLGRFFYRPVLKAMRNKEAETADRLERADRRLAEVDKLRHEAEQVRRDAQQEAERQLARARAEAEAERQRLAEKARAEAALIVEKARESVIAERASAERELESDVRTTAIELATRLVERIAGESVHHVLIARLVDQLSKSARIGNGAPGSILVETTYELTDEERSAIERALTSYLQSETVVRPTYRTNTELVAGLRIQLTGSLIDMSVRGALASIREARAAGDGDR